uniref:Uncharacterized protein n=1 Tax=Rhodnius prolixus TaxID=13249 RepID=T1HP13_RHOPR
MEENDELNVCGKLEGYVLATIHTWINQFYGKVEGYVLATIHTWINQFYGKVEGYVLATIHTWINQFYGKVEESRIIYFHNLQKKKLFTIFNSINSIIKSNTKIVNVASLKSLERKRIY